MSMSMSSVWSSRSIQIVLVGALCAGLLGSAVTSASASEAGGGDGRGSVVVGPFAVADGFSATIDERDGSVRFAVPIGPIDLTWDSRRAGVDEFGLGAGWGHGLARVSTAGGVTVHLPTGESFQASASTPSGLAGYGVHDVRFEQRAGALPARTVDAPGELAGRGTEAVPYAFELHQLGGVVTYYAASGLPVVQTSASGARTDWMWHPQRPGVLSGVVDPDGVVTTLDWSDPGSVLVTPAANLPGEVDPVTGVAGSAPTWRVRLDGERIADLEDPTGGRYIIHYDRVSGLVSRVGTPSGGSTGLAWTSFSDGTARIGQIRTVDTQGAELSVREWAPGESSMTSSGWPVFSAPESVQPGDGEYATVVSDGATRVVSTYSARHLLLARRMLVTDAAGERVLQEQAFTYPEPPADPAALPGNWSRPTSTSITHRDAAGRTRTLTESTGYDEAGRQIRSSERIDGTVARSVDYDLTVSGDIRTERVVESDAETGRQTTTSRSFEYSPLGETVGRTVTTTRSDEAGVEASLRAEAVSDEAGSLRQTPDGVTYVYDAANRPVRRIAPGGEVTETRYWADGTRRELIRTGTDGSMRDTTGFYWDGDQLLNDTHTSSSSATAPVIVASYLVAATRLARSIGGPSHYAVTDRHGNVTELTDAAGDLVEQRTYSDYGLQRPATAGEEPSVHGPARHPFGYAGEYTDPDGTQYLRSRLYDPDSMRFTTRDRTDLHNRYAYADLNPITRIDPTGRAGEIDWFVVANWAMVGVGLLSGPTSVFSLVSMWRTLTLAVNLGVKAANDTIRAGAFAITGARTRDKVVAALSTTLIDLPTTGIAATVLAHRTIRPLDVDPNVITALEATESIGALGALSAVYLARKSLGKMHALNRYAEEDRIATWGVVEKNCATVTNSCQLVAPYTVYGSPQRENLSKIMTGSIQMPELLAKRDLHAARRVHKTMLDALPGVTIPGGLSPQQFDDARNKVTALSTLVNGIGTDLLKLG